MDSSERPDSTPSPANLKNNVANEAAADQLEDEDLGVFGPDSDIQTILRVTDWHLDFVVSGSPNLAVIRRNDDNELAFLKFVKTGGESEVEILKYLSGIDSSTNHTISDCRYWTVKGGTVICMPPAGRSPTKYQHLNEQLWFVATQLVEAVDFMHEHGVAHMDIKPRNVPIPPEGGRLTVIDFSSAIRISDAQKTYHGVVGTESYIAPEVKKGTYRPFEADLFSCGRTLEELCGHCRDSPNRTFILDLAHKLMSEDPTQRPSMGMVRCLMSSRTLPGGDVGTNPVEVLPETPVVDA